MPDTIKNRFTKVPNTRLETVYHSKLNATQLKVVLVVNTDFYTLKCLQPVEALPVSESTNQERKYINKVKDVQYLFNTLWNLYPSKKGKAKATASAKSKMDKLGYIKINDLIRIMINSYIFLRNMHVITHN